MAQSPFQLQRKLRGFRKIKTCVGQKAKRGHRTAGSIQKIHIVLKAFAPETDLNHVSERIQVKRYFFEAYG
jgi:hypothetical protein